MANEHMDTNITGIESQQNLASDGITNEHNMPAVDNETNLQSGLIDNNRTDTRELFDTAASTQIERNAGTNTLDDAAFVQEAERFASTAPVDTPVQDATIDYAAEHLPEEAPADTDQQLNELEIQEAADLADNPSDVDRQEGAVQIQYEPARPDTSTMPEPKSVDQNNQAMPVASDVEASAGAPEEVQTTEAESAELPQEAYNADETMPEMDQLPDILTEYPENMFDEYIPDAFQDTLDSSISDPFANDLYQMDTDAGAQQAMPDTVIDTGMEPQADTGTDVEQNSSDIEATANGEDAPNSDNIAADTPAMNEDGAMAGSREDGDSTQTQAEGDPTEIESQPVALDNPDTDTGKASDQYVAADDLAVTEQQASTDNMPQYNDVETGTAPNDTSANEQENKEEARNNGSSLEDTISASVVDSIQGISDMDFQQNYENIQNMYEGTDTPCTTDYYADIVANTLDDASQLIGADDSTSAMSDVAVNNAQDNFQTYLDNNDLVDIDSYDNNDFVDINEQPDSIESDPIGVEDLDPEDY